MDSLAQAKRPRRQRMVLVFVNDGHILLIERVRCAIIDGKTECELYYVFPGGGVKEGELPPSAVLREGRREVTADIKRVRHLFSIGGVVAPPGFPRNPHPLLQDEHFVQVLDWEGTIKVGMEFREKEAADPRNRYSLHWVPFEKILHKPHLRFRKGAVKLVDEYVPHPQSSHLLLRSPQRILVTR